MKTSKKDYGYVVTAPEGTDLRRVPLLSSKTADGLDNVILKLPLGTGLTPVSAMIENDGRGWVVVNAENGTGEETGWIDTDHWRSPSRYVVAGQEGTYIRRERSFSSKTADGKDNILHSLSPGTKVMLISEGFQDTDDGHKWGLVRPENGSIAEIGWVEGDSLLVPEMLVIISQEGADLRREPTLNPKTEDGRDNIMRSLLVETHFMALNAKKANWDEMPLLPSGIPYIPVRMAMLDTNGREWVLGIVEIGDEAEVGWVHTDHLGIEQPLPQPYQYTPGDYLVSQEADGSKFYVKKADWESKAYIDQRIEIGYADPVPPSYTCIRAGTTRYKIQNDNWNRHWVKEKA